MPGFSEDFTALRARANSSFNYLLRKPNEPDTTHAKIRQEVISNGQLVEMRDILITLHALWQRFKDCPADDVNRQRVFNIIDFCYRCFCYAWVTRPANQNIYGSGMEQMKTEFSPALDDALQRYYPALFPPAVPAQRASLSHSPAWSMSCGR